MKIQILNITAWLLLLFLQVVIVLLLIVQQKEQQEIQASLAQWQSVYREQLAAIQGIDDSFGRFEGLLNDRLNRSSLLYEKALHTRLQKPKTEQTKETDLDRLSSAWIMPYPPFNRGRFLNFTSYSIQKNGDGSETVLFKEWNGSSLVQTSIPAKEVRWNVYR